MRREERKEGLSKRSGNRRNEERFRKERGWKSRAVLKKSVGFGEKREESKRS
jgi:hypothetical protein